MSIAPSTAALRAQIANAQAHYNTPKYHEAWWLLGTSGCHLCDEAAQVLSQLAAVYPVTYQPIDIADFDEDLMMVFATSIPVILTPSQRLDYPFSVMDLQRLL